MSKLYIERSVPLADFEISRSDGRTVTAYAATFDHAYPVADHDGEYDEVINRTAFNRELGRGFAHVSVMFHHGMTAFGTPSSGDNSRPVGTPIDIRADGKGLLTVTRYAKTALGDEMLELIRSEALRFQSFRGPVYDKSVVRRAAGGGRLIERTALGLTEYGPTMFPANQQAAILAVRSTALAEQIAAMPEEAREALARLIISPTPQDTPHGEAQEPATATPLTDGTDPGQEAPLDDDPSIELAELALAIRRRRQS